MKGLKNLISKVPGFRTGKRWKSVLAGIYYVLAVMMLFASGFWQFVFWISIPFIVLGIADFVRKHQPRQLLMGVIGVGLCMMAVSCGSATTKTNPVIVTPSPTAQVTATPLPTPEPTPVPTPVPTPEPTPVPTPVPTPEPTAVAAASSKNASSKSSGSTAASSAGKAAQAEEEPANGEMVWVGKTGTKYHYQSCPTLKGKGRKITMKEALAQGRTGCKVCKR